MGALALENLSKTYTNGVRAVRDVNLEVAEGELLVLVGPSGCGKTTTLRLIAGLESPTRGLVRIGGRAVNNLPPHARDVAMVFQRPALYPHRTVRDNLALGLDLRTTSFWPSGLRQWLSRKGVSAAGDGRDERVREVARLLDLLTLLDRLPGELSGGQQQRVALGRAL